MKYLKESRPVWNYSNNEIESVVYIAFVASVLSVLEVSPTIVANVELKTSKGLHLQQKFTIYNDQCYGLLDRQEMDICAIDTQLSWAILPTWLVN